MTLQPSLHIVKAMMTKVRSYCAASAYPGTAIQRAIEYLTMETLSDLD